MFKLDISDYEKIAPKTPQGVKIRVVNGLNDICPLYQIDSADILHEFLANLLHESGEFKRLSESLDYSVSALTTKFSRQRISEVDAKKYGRIDNKRNANQVMIANILYGGLFGRKNLGNINPGDGWTFRGAGPIQITGRGNAEAFTAYYNKRFSTSFSAPEMMNLLRTDIEYGIHASCWIFAVSKSLIDEAANDYMNVVVKKINGGFMGLAERMRYYELCKKWIIDK